MYQNCEKETEHKTPIFKRNDSERNDKEMDGWIDRYIDRKIFRLF
jgi:hypothetical protein